MRYQDAGKTQSVVLATWMAAGHVDGSWRTGVAGFHHLSVLEGVGS